MSVLAVRDLTKTFGALKALQHVNFEVGEGEILGIIGPNGAGKTTLFNVIVGIYRPDGGDVSTGGRASATCCPTRYAGEALRRRPRSFIPFSP